jgi:hypothetical protein
MGDIIPRLGKWYLARYNGKTLEGMAVEISFVCSIVTLWLRHDKSKEQPVPFAAIRKET